MKTLHSPPDDRELLRLLSGELPAEEAESLRQRIADEPAFRAAYSRLSGSWQRLELPPPTPPPAGYAERLTVRATTAITLAPLSRRRWLVMALLVSLGMNLGLVLSALLAPTKARAARGGASLAVETGVEKVADELGLTGAERRQFVERHRQFLDEARGPRERARRLRSELTQELFARPANQARIDELVAALGVELARFESDTARLVLEVQQLLPAERHPAYRRFLAGMKPDDQPDDPAAR